MIDLGKIQKEIDDGFINVQFHPTANLKIYNYSAKAQFEWHWTNETKVCRGLILDLDGKIVSRPFEKFFSYEQLNGEIPLEPFETFEKMDGSLGISYQVNGKPHIATRGSFISEQALTATRILQTKYKGLKLSPDLTYLFEIIYPGNRIVVDYGQTEDLILLAIIDTQTGTEFSRKDLERFNPGFPLVIQYHGFTQIQDLQSLDSKNKEGFVLRFKSGQRVKIKFEEHKRLHRLLTGINARHIWELLKDGKGIESIIEKVPDEYFQWATEIERNLLKAFENIENAAKVRFKDLGDRKETALYFQTYPAPYPAILFSMLDGKDYKPHIWKVIKPLGERAFRCDIDQ